MTEHEDGGHSIEVQGPPDTAELPEELKQQVKSLMPPDHVKNIENRIGWDRINRVDDLNYAIQHALDEDQQEFDGPFKGAFCYVE